MIRSLFLALCCLAVALGSAAAQDRNLFVIKVEAGDYDREYTPVRVTIPSLREIANAPLISVVDGDAGIPAQETARSLLGGESEGRELHFVVPELKAGTSFTCAINFPVSFSDELKAIGYRWSDDGEFATDLKYHVERKDSSLSTLRYVHPKLDDTDAKTREATYKPFHHVYSPNGERIVTKGPGGQFTHHRGLYFGFNRITYGEDKLTCDVWHCKAPAYQRHEDVLSTEEGLVLGRHRVQIAWHGTKGEKFAEEHRELTSFNAGKNQFIEFASVVRTTGGNIRLDGDPQHAGFHFRADNEVAEKTKSQTYYLRPDGKGKPGETRNWDAKSRNPLAVNEPWKVLSFVLGGVRYSALYLDHPNNPKEARSSERDYGRFGSYFEYDITPEKPLKVNYRVILKEGEFTPEEAVRLSNDFVHPPKVTITQL